MQLFVQLPAIQQVLDRCTAASCRCVGVRADLSCILSFGSVCCTGCGSYPMPESPAAPRLPPHKCLSVHCVRGIPHTTALQRRLLLLQLALLHSLLPAACAASGCACACMCVRMCVAVQSTQKCSMWGPVSHHPCSTYIARWCCCCAAYISCCAACC